MEIYCIEDEFRQKFIEILKIERKALPIHKYLSTITYKAYLSCMFVILA